MGHRSYKLSVPRFSNYLAILHYGFASQYRTYGDACNLPAMVRSPADLRIGRFVADYLFLIHVDNDHISVGARLDDAFSRVDTENASGIVRRNADHGIQRYLSLVNGSKKKAEIVLNLRLASWGFPHILPADIFLFLCVRRVIRADKIDSTIIDAFPYRLDVSGRHPET